MDWLSIVGIKMTLLFGTSGIRGLIDKKLTPEFCVKIGLAAASFYSPESTLIVGYDHRPQARVVSTALISGLLAGGANVIDVGVIPTPAALYAIKELDTDGAIVVTGSHTIPEIIGILFFKDDTSELSKEEETKFEEIFFNEKYKREPWNRVGKLEYLDILDIYMESVLSLIDTSKVEGRKIVIDSGNSCASGILKEIFTTAGVKTIAINDYPDPLFPGRGPFPRTDNLQELGEITRTWEADIGVGVDGDGDRALFCDERGTVYWGDVSGAIFAAYAVKRGIKNVVVTINTSHIVSYAVRKMGGNVIFSRVGPPAIAETMKKHNAGFGIEESGKYLWADAIYYGDAALAGLRMLEILDISGKTFSQLASEFPKYYMEKVAIKCGDELKKKVLEKSSEILKNKMKEDITDIITIDGVKVILSDDSWILLRPSGTEPVFRVFAESNDKKRVHELIKLGEEVVKKAISMLSN